MKLGSLHWTIHLFREKRSLGEKKRVGHVTIVRFRTEASHIALPLNNLNLLNNPLSPLPVMATDPSIPRKASWAYAVPKIAPSTYANVSGLMRFLILATISAAAVSSRLFAVIRHESIIHEL